MPIYYHISKGNETFNRISAFFNRIREVNQITTNFVRTEFGVSAWYSRSEYVAGGLAAIHFPEKPENWAHTFQTKKHQNLFYPKSCKENRELLDRLNALPSIRAQELKEVLGYTPITSQPGVVFSDDDFLITVPTGGLFTEVYTPLPFMDEITGSRFLELKGQIVAKNKESEQ